MFVISSIATPYIKKIYTHTHIYTVYSSGTAKLVYGRAAFGTKHIYNRDKSSFLSLFITFKQGWLSGRKELIETKQTIYINTPLIRNFDFWLLKTVLLNIFIYMYIYENGWTIKVPSRKYFLREIIKKSALIGRINFARETFWLR